MTLVNVFEAKTHLSDLLDRAAAGERILICKRNQPVAELRPVVATRTTPRPIGGAKGLVAVSPAFFDPLPADETEAFEEGAVYPPARPTASRVAERSPAATPGRTRGRSKRR